MKLIRNFLIGLFTVLVVFIVALLIFINTVDVNKFIPQITKSVSETIKRRVIIENAKLSFSIANGFVVNLKEVKVGNEADRSGDLLTIQNIFIKVNIFAILKGQIDLNDLTLSNIKLSFEDVKSNVKIDLPINKIHLSVPNFSISNQFTVKADISLLSNNENIHIETLCAINATSGVVELSNFSIKSDLSLLNLSELKNVSNLISTIPIWPTELKGLLNIQIPSLRSNSTGLSDLNLDLQITDGFIKIKEVYKPIEKITILLNTDLKKVSIKQFDLVIGSGQLNATSTINDLLRTPNYVFNIDSKGINIIDLIDQSQYPSELYGTILFKFNGNGSSFDPKLALDMLKGEGQFLLVDAKINKINLNTLIDTYFGKVPVLGDALKNSISSDLKDKLNVDTILLDKVEGKLLVSNSRINLIDAIALSKFFEINASGDIGFNMVTSIKINTALSKDISESLIKSTNILESLLDNQGRLQIPGSIEGVIPKVKYLPRLDDISKKIAIKEGSKQLERVLDKNPQVRSILNSVFGSSQEPSSENANTSSQENSGNSSDSKDVVNNVLNKIFK